VEWFLHAAGEFPSKLCAKDFAMTTTLTMQSISLGQIAHARSGDKGNHANICVVAYNRAGYEFLLRELTADRVAEFFSELGCTAVDRFELGMVDALNFVLYNALAGGASRSLRIDTQGKLLGTAILDLSLPAPPETALAEMLPDEAE
jgi:hypothetical protein